MARKYNFIYRRLVQSESDMIGHIAYSLYKAEKISWIEEHKAANEGREPTEAEFEKYHDACCSGQRISNYRSMASGILQAFMGGSTDDMAEQVAREVSDKVTAHINKNVAPLMPQRESWKSRYFHGAMQSMIGAIVLPLIVGVVLFAWKHSMNEVWKALAEFFGSLAQ